MAQIKIKPEDNSTELWIDGEFQASWLMFDIPKPISGRIEAMIDYAVEVGELKKSKEIRNVLGLDGQCDKDRIQRETSIDYKELFLAAKRYIDESQRGTDISPAQLRAWQDLQNQMEKHGV